MSELIKFLAPVDMDMDDLVEVLADLDYDTQFELIRKLDLRNADVEFTFDLIHLAEGMWKELVEGEFGGSEMDAKVEYLQRISLARRLEAIGAVVFGDGGSKDE